MGSTSRTMGCADSTDEKVEEKVEKTLEEQLADAEADLAAAESCRDENAENAGTVDDKKAAQEGWRPSTTSGTKATELSGNWTSKWTRSASPRPS